MTRPRQCAILAGGSGTRLGELTKHVPKPLLTVGDRPFLAHLIGEVARHGFGEILILAGNKADAFGAQFDALRMAARHPVKIRILAEAEPLGTAGAIKAAASDLNDEFLLLNGDSFLDLNLLDLASPLPERLLGRIALRPSADVARFGAVTLEGEQVTSFIEKSAATGSGLINGGAYWLRREIIDDIGVGAVSLETDILPRLAASGRLLGRIYDRFFIDIGIPEALRDAQTKIPEALSRPAVFFTADAVLTRKVQASDQADWADGAIGAIRWLNDRGYLVFVVGLTGDARRLEEALGAQGAHLDFYTHADGERMPEREIVKLTALWPVRRERSFIVDSARATPGGSAMAALPVRISDGGDLLQLVRSI